MQDFHLVVYSESKPDMLKRSFVFQVFSMALYVLGVWKSTKMNVLWNVIWNMSVILNQDFNALIVITNRNVQTNSGSIYSENIKWLYNISYIPSDNFIVYWILNNILNLVLNHFYLSVFDSGHYSQCDIWDRFNRTMWDFHLKIYFKRMLCFLNLKPL